jgi:hypothetical protein
MPRLRHPRAFAEWKDQFVDKGAFARLGGSLQISQFQVLPGTFVRNGMSLRRAPSRGP